MIDTSWIDNLVKSRVKTLIPLQKRVAEFVLCDTLPWYVVNDTVQAYFLESLRLQGNILYAAIEHFRNISEEEVQKAVRNNPDFLRLVKEDNELRKKLMEFMRDKQNQ